MANESEGRAGASQRNQELRRSWAKREAYWDTPESKARAKAAQDEFKTPFDELEGRWEKG